jgi:hypothetical protein
MRKVVPLFKTYHPIFYLENFETGKIKFGANQFRGRFKSNFAFDSGRTHLSATLVPLLAALSPTIGPAHLSASPAPHAGVPRPLPCRTLTPLSPSARSGPHASLLPCLISFSSPTGLPPPAMAEAISFAGHSAPPLHSPCHLHRAAPCRPPQPG